MLTISILAFTSILSGYETGVTVKDGNSARLNEVFITDFSGLRCYRLKLFPIFSTVFLLLLASYKFRERVFILGRPRGVKHLAESGIFLTYFVLASNTVLNLLIFTVLFNNECRIRGAAFFYLTKSLDLFFLT